MLNKAKATKKNHFQQSRGNGSFPYCSDSMALAALRRICISRSEQVSSICISCARSASASWVRPQSSRAFLIASPKCSCKFSTICSSPGKIVLMRDEKRNEPSFQNKHEQIFVTSEPCLYSPASSIRIFQQVWKKPDTSSRSYTFQSRW